MLSFIKSNNQTMINAIRYEGFLFWTCQKLAHSCHWMEPWWEPHVDPEATSFDRHSVSSVWLGSLSSLTICSTPAVLCSSWPDGGWTLLKMLDCLGFLATSHSHFPERDFKLFLSTMLNFLPCKCYAFKHWYKAWSNYLRYKDNCTSSSSSTTERGPSSCCKNKTDFY